MVKFPQVKVDLIGKDGNAFAILSAVTRAMMSVGVSKEDITNYRNEAMSGDYDNLLAVTMETVNVN